MNIKFEARFSSRAGWQERYEYLIVSRTNRNYCCRVRKPSAHDLHIRLKQYPRASELVGRFNRAGVASKGLSRWQDWHGGWKTVKEGRSTVSIKISIRYRFATHYHLLTFSTLTELRKKLSPSGYYLTPARLECKNGHKKLRDLCFSLVFIDLSQYLYCYSNYEIALVS